MAKPRSRRDDSGARDLLLAAICSSLKAASGTVAPLQGAARARLVELGEEWISSAEAAGVSVEVEARHRLAAVASSDEAETARLVLDQLLPQVEGSTRGALRTLRATLREVSGSPFIALLRLAPRAPLRAGIRVLSACTETRHGLSSSIRSLVRTADPSVVAVLGAACWRTESWGTFKGAMRSGSLSRPDQPEMRARLAASLPSPALGEILDLEWLKTGGSDPNLQMAVERALRSLAYRESSAELVKRFGVEGIEHLHRIGYRSLRSYVRSLVPSVIACGSEGKKPASELSVLLRTVYVAQPKLLEGVGLLKLRVESPYRFLAILACAPEHGPLLGILRRIKDSWGRPCWQRGLKYLRSHQAATERHSTLRTAKVRLVQAVVDAGPTYLERAFSIWPTAFVDHANDVSISLLARACLDAPCFGRVLVARTTVEDRRGLALETRRWKDLSPSQRVALELGLAFQPGAARFLLFLVATAWRGRGKRDGAERSAFDDLYRTYALPKKSGGTRQICVPDGKLKALQRSIVQSGLFDHWMAESAHGFRRGRSIVTNARPHAGQRVVVNIDISQFFTSVKRSQVRRVCWQAFREHLSPAAIELVVEICTFDGALPTGAPTSPAIANLVLTRVDHALEKACARRGLTYTRYADDLTFSGDAEVTKILPFARDLLGEIGLALDDAKTCIYRRGRRQIVTGLVVNVEPHLPRAVRRRLRAAVHCRAHGGQPTWHSAPISDNTLRGHLAHLNAVQPEVARRLRERLDASSTASDQT